MSMLNTSAQSEWNIIKELVSPRLPAELVNVLNGAEPDETDIQTMALLEKANTQGLTSSLLPQMALSFHRENERHQDMNFNMQNDFSDSYILLMRVEAKTPELAQHLDATQQRTLEDSFGNVGQRLMSQPNHILTWAFGNAAYEPYLRELGDVVKAANANDGSREKLPMFLRSLTA